MLSHSKIEEIVTSYKSKGFYHPIKLFDNNKDFYLKYLESVSKIKNSSLKFEHRFKSHLIFKWVNDLMRDKRIISLVSPILGENILCWNSIFFYKPKKTKYFVGWHEDKTYWKLKNNNIITVSIALTVSNLKNGCLKISKHKINKVQYRTNNPKYNMLARGQDAILDLNTESEDLILNAGECAIFNQEAVHGSGPNNSDEDRLLLAFRFISPENITDMNHKSATLVSGVDNYNFYEKEPQPRFDLDPVSLKFHQEKMAKQAMIFGREKLNKYYLGFLSSLIKIRKIRELYYNYFK
jgi:non-heme Fe2+,alpha-ketoglutarate-dependent halogenase|tara:strand:- start:1066 stop:1950 length:885 start_codon:yes stop_codon:yes gene_type:complete